MMKNANLLDQFFLVDQTVVEDLVKTAELTKSDRVLEIGAGKGIVTREIAKKAGQVLAVELDESFKSDLAKLPKNVKIIFGNALDVLETKPKFNKIISSLPSSIVEPLFNRLTHIKFDLASLLVPLKFVNNLQASPFYAAYFQTELIRKVDKTSFDPRPKTNWALVKITRKPDPLVTKDYERFIGQYLFEHPQTKLKNALMDAVILIEKSKGNTITKNQAREVVKKLKTPAESMEKKVGEIKDINFYCFIINSVPNNGTI